MMKANLEVRGLRSLDKKLSKIAKSLPENTQRRILEEAGEIIADEARALVPVDSGNLKGSITVTDQRLGGAFKMDGGLKSDGVTVYIGPTKGGRPNGWYAHFVEFGTVNMAARPFMRPAYDNTEGQVRSRISNEVTMQVHKAAKG